MNCKEILEGCFKKIYPDKFADKEALEESKGSFCKKVINFTRRLRVHFYQNVRSNLVSKFYQRKIIPLSRTELFCDSRFLDHSKYSYTFYSKYEIYKMLLNAKYKQIKKEYSFLPVFIDDSIRQILRSHKIFLYIVLISYQKICKLTSALKGRNQKNKRNRKTRKKLKAKEYFFVITCHLEIVVIRLLQQQ